ncbi:hypothetical protein CC79DRAFT_1362994 [Sarocladium strictum]
MALVLANRDKASLFCNLCDRSFNSQAALAQHVLNAVRHRECDTCNIRFAQYEDLQQHLHDATVHRQYREPPPERHVSYRASQQQVTHASPFECSICGRVFKSEAGLEQHIRATLCWKHLPRSNDSQPRLGWHGDVYNACGLCNRTFESEQALARHIKTALNHFACPTCDEYFDDEVLLEGHRFDEHNWCDVCDLDFTDSQAFDDHDYDEHSMCLECGKFFGDSKARDQHFAAVHRKEPYECFVCSRDFRLASSLVLHLESGQCTPGLDEWLVDHVVHRTPGSHLYYDPDSNWPYSCVQCDSTFMVLSALYQQLKSSASCYATSEMWQLSHILRRLKEWCKGTR